MRQSARIVLASAALALLRSPALGAQVVPVTGSVPPSHRLVRVGLGGGVTVPVADASGVFESGIHGQGYLLVTFGELPPLRLNLAYQKFDLKSAAQQAPSGSTSMFSGVVGLSVDLVHAGPIRPYVTAGLGAFRVKSELEGGTSGSGDNSSSTEFGIDGGVGIVFRLGRLEGFVEARVQNVYTEAGLADVSSIRTVPVTFGVLF